MTYKLWIVFVFVTIVVSWRILYLIKFGSWVDEFVTSKTIPKNSRFKKVEKIWEMFEKK